MTKLLAVLTAWRDLLFGSLWNPLARGAWCRRQRRRLHAPGQAVVWVPVASVQWAEWGAAHGFFAIERMSGLPYLSAVSAPAA